MWLPWSPYHYHVSLPQKPPQKPHHTLISTTNNINNNKSCNHRPGPLTLTLLVTLVLFLPPQTHCDHQPQQPQLISYQNHHLNHQHQISSNHPNSNFLYNHHQNGDQEASINGDEDQRSEIAEFATNIDLPQSPRTTTTINTKTIPLVNLPMQITLLLLILLTALLTNLSLILNISSDPLKLRMLHFILIRHVCITDLLGTCLVLPSALGAVILGPEQFFSSSTNSPPEESTVCTVVSVATAACWTMHLVAVGLYRADRVLALWCPTGRYPVVGVNAGQGVLALLWFLSISGSYLATLYFRPNFQPALALCIPDVPLIFFILLFSVYCLGLLGLTTGYVFAFARRRRRRKKNHHHGNGQNSPQHLHLPHLQLHVPKFVDLGTNAPFEPEPDKSSDSSSSDCSSSSSSSDEHLVYRSRAFSDSRILDEPSKIIKNATTPFLHRRACSESSKVQFQFQLKAPEISLAPVAPAPIAPAINSSFSSSSSSSSSSNCSNPSTSPLEQPPPIFNGSIYTRLDEEVETVEQEVEAESPIAPIDQLLQQPNQLEKLESPTTILQISNPQLHQHQHQSLRNCTHHRVHRPTRLKHFRPKPPPSTSSSLTPGRKRALLSYTVSIGHLLLYLPAMFVVGLSGAKGLPPGVALFCGIVVYCDFLVQPIALLLISRRLREEVRGTVRGLVCCRGSGGGEKYKGESRG